MDETKFEPSPLAMRLSAELTPEEREFAAQSGEAMSNAAIERFIALLLAQPDDRKLPALVALQICGEAMLHVVTTLIATAGGLDGEAK